MSAIKATNGSIPGRLQKPLIWNSKFRSADKIGNAYRQNLASKPEMCIFFNCFANIEDRQKCWKQ